LFHSHGCRYFGGHLRDRESLVVANANNTLTEMRASIGSLVRRISGAAYRFSHPVALTIVVAGAGFWTIRRIRA
jgi:hypothetical protein